MHYDRLQELHFEKMIYFLKVVQQNIRESSDLEQTFGRKLEYFFNLFGTVRLCFIYLCILMFSLK